MPAFSGLTIRGTPTGGAAAVATQREQIQEQQLTGRQHRAGGQERPGGEVIAEFRLEGLTGIKAYHIMACLRNVPERQRHQKWAAQTAPLSWDIPQPPDRAGFSPLSP